ncbi:MAG: BON domain-containing protein [Burkholderiales bacterium]|jgi:osmotically-inducible protein OsmY|nr:BON domain-containing protein [Burkholderiales bacterium]
MNNPIRKPLRKTLAIATAGVLSLGLIACDQKPSAEQVGKDIDRAVDKTGEQLAQAADKAGDKMERARTAVSEKAANAGAAVADAAITAKVKSALVAEPGLKSTGIDVVTEKGVVSLYGTTVSDASRDRATQLAAAVEGVKAVENNLAVVQGS